MSGIHRCHYCHDLIDPLGPATYTRVVGWERKSLDPQRKHGSDIKLREPTDVRAFACSTCIERLRSGLNVGQEALL